VSENHDRNLAIFEVLPIAKVLAGRQKQLIAGLHRGGEKIAISQALPSQVRRDSYRVAGQMAANRDRLFLDRRESALWSVSGSLIEATRSKLDHLLHSSSLESVEPLHDVVDARSGFEILKKT
jgi:hypothetical protein